MEHSPKSAEKKTDANVPHGASDGEKNPTKDLHHMGGQSHPMHPKPGGDGQGQIKTTVGAWSNPIHTSTWGIKGPTSEPEENGPLVPEQRFQEAVERLQDGEGKLDEDAAKLLGQLAEEFAKECLQMGGALAQHRGSKKMEIKDVMTYLERQHHMRVPGFGPPNLSTFHRRKDNPIHRERLAAVRRASAQDAAEALKRRRKEAAAHAAQKEAAEARERKAEEAAREEEEDEEKREPKEVKVETKAD